MAASDFTKLGKANDDISLAELSIADNNLTIRLTKADGTALESTPVALPSNTTPTQEKSVTITTNGTTAVTPDSGYALSKVSVTTNVPKTPTQEKSVTITTNGTRAVTPNSGYALSKVSVTTNVPSPVGYFSYSEVSIFSGDDTDPATVTSYTTVLEPNITIIGSSGGSVRRYLDAETYNRGLTIEIGSSKMCRYRYVNYSGEHIDSQGYVSASTFEKVTWGVFECKSSADLANITFSGYIYDVECDGQRVSSGNSVPIGSTVSLRYGYLITAPMDFSLYINNELVETTTNSSGEIPYSFVVTGDATISCS